MRRFLVPLAVVFTLVGCASSVQPEQTQSPDVTTDATPEQVASVLAKYSTEWRETIDAASDCRFIWVLGEDVTDEIRGATCYLNEQTIGLTAQLVLRDWEQLAIPASMTDIVGETSAILEQLSAVDLLAACGEGELPVDDASCDEALGARNFTYNLLGSQLDAWAPYL